MAKRINEATSTDLPVIQRLVTEYGWKVGDTLLYQQTYDIPENLKKDYGHFKNIRPDIVLQDLNGEVLAVIENNLDRENKDLLKLRTVVTHLPKPHFLYACSTERILFYDNAWRGLDAGAFKQLCLHTHKPSSVPKQSNAEPGKGFARGRKPYGRRSRRSAQNQQ